MIDAWEPKRVPETQRALDHLRGRVPLYTISEAARILDMRALTLETWVNGYEKHYPNRPPVTGAPFITRLSTGSRRSIPFVGLAEAFVVCAFRSSGGSLHKVRRALSVLEQDVGLDHALASRQLYLLGPDLLYDFANRTGDRSVMDLVQLHDGQRVFVPVVADYLKNVTYDDGGWASQLRLHQYRVADVRVDPHHTSGDPYFAKSGVRVEDVVSRFRAGDPIDLLAEDYDIPPEEVREAAERAGLRAA